MTDDSARLGEVPTDRGGESVERPEVPIQIITPDDARASIRRAKVSLEKAANEIVWQVEREAWRTLGYSSWNAMREAEYGDAAFLVPSKQRPELVARMKVKGLTNADIAATAGVHESTVGRDLANASSELPPSITNARGQQRPATYTRAESAPDATSAHGNAVTTWSKQVQRVSAECPVDDLTDEQLEWLGGAADFLLNLTTGVLVLRQHSLRFRKVSNRYPRRVAEAYDGDIAAAASDDDATVAARAADWERAHGLPVTDWVALGDAERG